MPIGEWEGGGRGVETKKQSGLGGRNMVRFEYPLLICYSTLTLQLLYIYEMILSVLRTEVQEWAFILVCHWLMQIALAFFSFFFFFLLLFISERVLGCWAVDPSTTLHILRYSKYVTDYISNTLSSIYLTTLFS